MKKALCLLVCFTMILGIVSSTVYAVRNGGIELSAIAISSGNGIELPDITLTNDTEPDETTEEESEEGSEDESEDESEEESEFESDYESEDESEFESDYESEDESEFESEDESEEESGFESDDESESEPDPLDEIDRIVASPVSIIVGTNINRNEYQDEHGQLIEYEYYDYLRSCAFTVYFKNGQTQQFTGGTFIYDGVEYRIAVNDDQNENNTWDVGEHQADGSLLGVDFTINVTILPTPIKSITAQRYTIIENTYTFTQYYNDGNEDIPFTVYRDVYRDVMLHIEFKDGRTVDQSLNTMVDYDGVGYFIKRHDGQDYQHQWGVGKHDVACSVLGYDFNVEVQIIENPISSITASPVTLYEGDFNCHMEVWVESEHKNVEFDCFDYRNMCSYTVNFKNGGSFTFGGDWFEYEGNRYEVSLRDDQNYDNIWGAGEHQATGTLTGIEFTVPVTVTGSPVKSITADKYTMIENTYTRTEEYRDGENVVTYKLYTDEYRMATVHIELNDGTKITQDFHGSVNYNGQEHFIEWHDGQDYQHQWSVGTHYVECSLLGYEFTLEVEIIESPVESVDIAEIVIMEGTGLGVGHYRDEHDQEHEYNFYNYADKCSFTVHFKDNTSANVENGGRIKYGDVYLVLQTRDDQSHQNVWEAGKHIAEGNFGGFDFEIEVTIKENPVKSFDVKDAVVNAASTDRPEEAAAYLQKHITFEITTSGGEKLTGNLYDGIVIDGAVVKPDTDGLLNSMNTGVRQYECSLGDLSDTFTLTILRNPFDGASPAVQIRMPDTAEKKLMTGYVDGREVQYYAYDWTGLVGDVKVRITNDVCEHILASASYVQNDEYTKDEYNRVYEALDRAGERFAESIIRCSLDNFASDYGVTTVGMTRDELENDPDMLKIFAGITWRYLEVNDGKYTGVSTGKTYTPGQFNEADLFEEIRLAYTDPQTGKTDYTELSALESGYDTLFRCVEWEAGIERCITVKDGAFEYGGIAYTYVLRDDQIKEEWKKGENFAEIDIIDETGSICSRGGFGIELYKNIEVQSITVQPVTVYEYDSHTVENEHGKFREFSLWPNDLEITVTVNGIAHKIDVDECWVDPSNGRADIRIEYEDEEYYIGFTGWQCAAAPWQAGENTVNCELCGTTGSFIVTVVDISSVVIEDLSIIVGTECDENGYYNYFPIITVNYTDGSSIKNDEDRFKDRYYTEISDTQHISKWGIGDHTAYVSLNDGEKIEFTVKIIDNPAVSLTANDIKIFEEKNGYVLAVYNSKTGKYVRGNVYNGEIEATVTFRDGSSVSGVDELEYKGTIYPVNVTNITGMLNEFALGSGVHTVTIEVMGLTTTFKAQVIESYYDTHAFVTAEDENMLKIFTVLDDDRYEKGTVITVKGLDPLENALLYLAISANLDGSTDFYAAGIKAEKNGSRVQPNGTVRVKIDFSAFADQIPDGYGVKDAVIYSCDKKGKLTKLTPVYDEKNMTITFELDSNDYYVMALSDEPEEIKGDIDGDGEATNKDVIYLFRYLSGANKSIVLERCDFNGDGKVNNKDVTLLFRYVSNK